MPGTQVIARSREGLVYVGVWLATTVFVWLRLDQGWVAHDDGAFAQMATRVLDGELPHREFADLYTGGMTFLNAATMYVFGEDIVVLRYPLFLVFLGFFPASYYIARRISGTWTALAGRTFTFAICRERIAFTAIWAIGGSKKWIQEKRPAWDNFRPEPPSRMWTVTAIWISWLTAFRQEPGSF